MGLWGCGAPNLEGAQPNVAGDPTPLSKCKVAASASSPLVTEWPASEKAHLESLIGRGAVAVEYSGCELSLVDACQLPGSYGFRRTTPATDTVDIENADELWAKLPLGAAALEGELGRTGRLAVRTTVTGQLALGTFDAASVGAQSGCERATHVISAVSVGAFRLVSGGSVQASGGASVVGVGAGASTKNEEQVMRTAGDLQRCAESSDEAPHRDCASPIQLFLQPLASGPSEVKPRAAANAPLPPSAGVVVDFPAPEDAEEAWTLHDADGIALCGLPCNRVVPNGSGYYLEGHVAGSSDITRLDLPARPGFAAGTNVRAQYRPERGEPFLSKLTFYGLGIPAAVGGVATLVLGIVSATSDDEKDNDRAGIWFAATGMYWGISAASFWWFTWSHDSELTLANSATAAKAGRNDAAAATPGLTLRFGPGAIGGSF